MYGNKLPDAKSLRAALQDKGKRVEQGSTSYVQSVVENMQREYNKAIGTGNNSAEIKALGNTLEAFKNYSGKIEFRKVQQGFQTGSSLKPTFDVTNYTIGSIKLWAI